MNQNIPIRTGTGLLTMAFSAAISMLPIVASAESYQSPIHTFSINDIQGGFDGSTYGMDVSNSPYTILCGDGSGNSCPSGIEPMTDKDGDILYPVDNEFGFYVVDFLGAKPKLRDGDYKEGFAGNITDGGNVVGLKISNAATDTYKVKRPLGTWCQGLGGNSVKCSTEHYVVMEHTLSCHEVVPYRYANIVTGEQAALAFPDGSGDIITGETVSCTDAALDDELDILVSGQLTGNILTSAVPGDQILANDNTTIRNDVAVSSDYSVTLKDDGKPLYRWGSLIKRPNDMRIYARLALPAEWKGTGAPVYKVTRARLTVRHWVTNNPNDQLRPEDLENEAATGRKPSYNVSGDLWTSLRECYEGDGDFIDNAEGGAEPQLLPAGSVFRNIPFRVSEDSTDPRAFSSDLKAGFSNGYYTTMDRDPFEWSYDMQPDNSLVQDYQGFPVPNDALGEPVSGPRWRLKANKFGQDLPGVEIPLLACSKPPFTKENIKYEVGEETTTVINLLDWKNGEESPLLLSTGWVSNNGVTGNGLPRTDDFDLAVYIKGDRKPTALYTAMLNIEYEASDGVPGGGDYDLGLTASVYSSTAAELFWNSPPDGVAVTTWEVYRDGVLVQSADARSYFDDTLVRDTSYVYEVRAIDSLGNVVASATIGVPDATDPGDGAPSIPANLTGAVYSSTAAEIFWDAATDDVAVVGYDVYRDGVLILNMADVKSYFDASLMTATSYTYQVVAVDNEGNKSAAASISLTTN